jgi:F-type H+-transporting ATPase subunit b
MQIDWLTVIAQIFNFLILVWLLKRFLYQPIIDAMSKREQRISEGLRQAELRERAADESINIYQSKLEQLEQEAQRYIEDVKQTAQTERFALLDEAGSAADEARVQWQRQIEEEKQNFLASLKNLAAQMIEATTRRALSDLAQQQLEAQIIQVFMQKLENFDAESISASGSLSSASPIQITSSFELDLVTREKLRNLVQKQLSSRAMSEQSIEICFSESPELISGIELTAPGVRLSWTIADYLNKFEQTVQTALDEKIGKAAT